MGRPELITAPSFSPRQAAEAAMADYDTNKDGKLDSQELKRCPALAYALKSIDKDGDGKISLEELTERLDSFAASNIGLVGIPCSVKLSDANLAGATVTLRPEKFMGDAFKPASGVSDDGGHVIFKTEGQDVPGVRFGYFRIEVSKLDAAGKETLPAKYNTATTLGQEIGVARREGMVLRLAAR
jgi:hypothetical protein